MALDLQLFVERPWGRMRFEPLEKVDALLHPEERKIFFWSARDLYTGAGEIIDAGSFLGGSAHCMGLGLSQNKMVPEERKLARIHCYDLFTKGDWVLRQFDSLDAIELNATTLGIFHSQVRQVEDHLVIYPGNILNRRWSQAPIELLMLDCSKTRELNDHCMRMFFPSLIPEKSFILHQDYAIRSALYWLHASLHLLRGHFEQMTVVKYGGTTLFRCIHPISKEEVEQVCQDMDKDMLAILNDALAWERKQGDEKLIAAVESSIETYREEQK